MSDPVIRAMRPDEVALALEFAAREGWNPGLHDAACFAAADPDGFFLAEVDGRPVGCISAVSYEGRVGFIGLYIVVPEFRGRGIGWALWMRGMQRLASHLIGLDGVPAQQDNYRRSGFELAWQNVRYAGRADAGARAARARRTALVPLSQVPFAQVCADDRRVFPARRPQFLRAWIDMPEATGLACLDGERLTGWGVIRRCREGHKIGPLVADTHEVATALYAALCASVPGTDPVFLDVPMPSARAVALAEDCAMQPVFRTARMYTGPAPALELDRVYGITTFELG